MTAQCEQLLSAALALPPGERAALVEAISASLGEANRADLDALWAVEVEDRLAAYDRGETVASPAVDVFARISGRAR